MNDPSVKGISIIPILNLLREIQSGNIKPYVWATWFSGFENSVTDVMPAGTKELRSRAIMKILGRHSLVSGCHCGCRGDYQITENGLQMLNDRSNKNEH